MTVGLAEISVNSFADFLRLFGVDVNSWGVGEAKSVKDFLKELGAGESFLRIDKNGIARVLRVVKMIIEDNSGKALIEDYQILPDGRKKHRNQNPGGKIGINETPLQALHREIEEELGDVIKSGDYEVEILEVFNEERPSKAYPTLRSIYEVNKVGVILRKGVNIPDGYHSRDKEDGKVLVFRWITQ